VTAEAGFGSHWPTTGHFPGRNGILCHDPGLGAGTVRGAGRPRYHVVGASPLKDRRGDWGEKDPGCPRPCLPPTPPPRFDPSAILRAAFIGILTTLSADLGAAAAFGPPITERDISAAVVGGAAAGIAGEIALELCADPALVAVITGLVGGFVTEALFPEAPIPLRARDIPLLA